MIQISPVWSMLHCKSSIRPAVAFDHELLPGQAQLLRPPNSRRSQSFSVPNPPRSDRDTVAFQSSSREVKGESYHGRTQHEKTHADDNKTHTDTASHSTMDDLNETIIHLKSSLMTHATSNAKTLERFSALQKAHDALYAEHSRL